MKLSDLHPALKSTSPSKRRGRGRASGMGKTSGRGQKGQNARIGKGPRLGLEGGQMPLIRRLPKRGFGGGFKRPNRIVQVGQLNRFKENASVTPKELEEAGLIDRNRYPVKVLGVGELKKSLQVSAHGYSRKARESIEKSGGKALIVGKDASGTG